MKQDQRPMHISTLKYRRVRSYKRRANRNVLKQIERRLTCKKRKVIDWLLFSLLIIMSFAASGAMIAIFALT